MARNDIEPDVTATPVGMSDPAGLVGTAPRATGERSRRSLVAGWHVTRHFLEMVIAMLVGMAVLAAAIGVLGEPPGYANLLVEYGLMGAAMSVPMVAWMRYRGHPWSDGLEMTAAMLVPMVALVLLVEPSAARNAPRESGHALMMLAHMAMFAGMIALMIYRRDRYAHGAHGRRT